jgi:hypothetical protein
MEYIKIFLTSSFNKEFLFLKIYPLCGFFPAAAVLGGGRIVWCLTTTLTFPQNILFAQKS